MSSIAPPPYPLIDYTIGHTPMVALQRLSPSPLATILVKLEFFSPGGSIKDRMVKFIVNDAERRGLIKPEGTIIEATSGNTGAAAALIGAQRGYHVVLTMPDKVSTEKQNALKAYGAEIIMCPTDAKPESPESYISKAKQLAVERPNSFHIDQYDNPLNPLTHYLTTGPEIWEQTHGHLDYFVASASTGGTISGVGKFLKEHNRNIKVVMPDPIGSIYCHYFNTKQIPEGGNCNYQLEGIGEDHIAKAMDFSVVDEIFSVSDKDAFMTARLLASKEGILAGGSSGANVWGAIQLAKRAKTPTVIVTVLPDGGIKYLSKCFNDEWMKNHHYL